MKKTKLFKSLLVAAGLLVGGSAWAEDWSTVWTADFSSAPSGMTYSVAGGSVDISTGVLFYHQGGGSGDRGLTTAFTADAFKVDTNWQMEFDWGASSANTNASNVAFKTNEGTAFTITWAKYATTVTITDANNTELTTTLPIDGYNKSTMTNLSHFIITGDKENNCIYLTVTNGGTTYVNNALVSSTYGYPSTFSGSLGRAVSHMALDNIVFKTPYVAGFVPEPTSTLTGADGVARKFTLSCTDPDATLYYSETELTADADGWTQYTSEVTTTAATIYAVAKKGSDASDVYSFATGAGTEITLNAPIISVVNMEANGDAFSASFNASYNASGVQFEPAATLSATFTPKGGEAAAVSMPFTPSADGVLKVTASANGFVSAETSINVYASYVQQWQSLDFSAITGDEVATLLGDNWSLQEGIGRWASWKDQAYTYYSDGSTSNITTNERLRMRGVISLNLGYGLGRNVNGSEAITVLSTSEGEIVAFQMYSGRGNYAVADANYYSYGLNNGTNPSVGTNSGALLVQATVYAPVKYTSMSIVGDFSEGGFDDLTKGIAMTRDADNPYVWTAVVKDFVITSSKYNYNYKAVADQDYSVYELPQGYNNFQNYNFDYDGARDGKYTLTFTVNTKNNSVNLAIEKQITGTIYYVNTWDWPNVCAWVWNDSKNFTGGSWPGQGMTKTEEKVDGHYVWTWSTYDLDTPTSVKFNDGSDNNQTGNFAYENGATYVYAGMTVVKTISAAGYATYCSDKALDFSNSGLNAYIAKKDASNNITFTPVTKVPANTGVLLKGDAGTYTINTTADATDDVTDNVLIGVTVNTQVPAGSFVLMNGTSGVGFYKTANAFTVGANTAYIAALPNGGSRSFIGFDFDGGTTAIDGVATVNMTTGEVYNLQGQRVSAAKKGLYIINGKKVLVK